MKPNKLTSLLLGGFITIFGVLNSARAQETNTMTISDHEKVSRNFYKLNDINYISDPETYGKDSSYFQTPHETFLRGEGACEDKSIFFQDELEKQEGIKTKLCYGVYKIGDPFQHIWLEGFLDGKYCIIECSGKGEIFSRDSIDNLRNCVLYVSSRDQTKSVKAQADFINYIRNQAKDYYDRTGKVLDIKSFEYLQKTIPQQTFL